MKKEAKVLMEKFRGFEIYYDKNDERFVADKKALDIHFEARTLWEMKGLIKSTRTKEIGQDAIIKSGYFDKSLSKIHVLTFNPEYNEVKYKVLDDTGNGYDVGRILKETDMPKRYPMSEHNLKIYDQVKKLEGEIKKIEKRQKALVSKLELGAKK